MTINDGMAQIHASIWLQPRLKPFSAPGATKGRADRLAIPRPRSAMPKKNTPAAAASRQNHGLSSRCRKLSRVTWVSKRAAEECVTHEPRNEPKHVVLRRGEKEALAGVLLGLHITTMLRAGHAS